MPDLDPTQPDLSPEDADAAAAAATHRRTVVFTALGGLLAAALLFAVVTRVTKSTTTSTATDGGRLAQFDLGRAQDFAPTIAKSGPLLFPDPKGRTNDIFIQHLGDTEWLAFEARASGAPRQCVLKWEHDAQRFVDPCDGRIYPADGVGLVSFPTAVNEKGRVIVDLSSPIDPTTTTTTLPTTSPSTAAPTTTTTTTTLAP